jgi:peptidoglycan hydrolase-like protein with peptidoglycan-binding domain
MFEKLKSWWGRLPAAQRTLIAVGIPVVGVAAIVNRKSAAPAEEETPAAAAEQDAYGATGLIAGGAIGAGADDLSSFADMFSGALVDLEGRLQAQIDAGGGGTIPTTEIPSTPAPVKPGTTTPASPGGTTTSPTGGGVRPPSGTPWLRRGSTGTRVKTLQRWLNQHGYNPGPRDGIYGPQTEAAVRRFQGAAGVKADGIYGPQTAAAALATRSTGTVAGQGGGRPISVGARVAVEPAVRPPAAASRIGALRDRQRIAALASARLGQ